MASRTLEQFSKDMRDASGPAGLKLAMNKLMAGMAIKGKTYAQQNYHKNGLKAPTGELKGSINARALASQEGIGILLRAGNRRQVVYAAVHEFGYPARNIPPRPDIRPAIENLRGELPDDIRDVGRGKVLGSGMVKL